MELFEKTILSETIYDGKVVKLKKDEVLLPNGEKSIREVVRHSGGACVLAVENDEMYFVKQFRYPYGKIVLEIPAGKINANEKPKLCAVRELEEETGLIADDVELLHAVYPTPGYTDEIIYVYLAKGLKKGTLHLDDDEFLNVEKIKTADVKRMLLNGEIRDGKTIIALYAYFFKG